MKENVRFYFCPICGNVIGLIDGDMDNVMCCGIKMELMQANTTDASQEKHVPVCEKVEDEIVVKVGKIEHPMEKEHYIMFIEAISHCFHTFPKNGEIFIWKETRSQR